MSVRLGDDRSVVETAGLGTYLALTVLLLAGMLAITGTLL